MKTIGTQIVYRGHAVDENLICDMCWTAMGNPTLKQIKKKLRTQFKSADSNGKRKK